MFTKPKDRIEKQTTKQNYKNTKLIEKEGMKSRREQVQTIRIEINKYWIWEVGVWIDPIIVKLKMKWKPFVVRSERV